MIHSYLEMVGTLPKSQFPEASHGPMCQAGLSKESRSKPVTLTLLSAQYAGVIGHLFRDKRSTLELKRKKRSIRENEICGFCCTLESYCTPFDLISTHQHSLHIFKVAWPGKKVWLEPQNIFWILYILRSVSEGNKI